MWCLTEIHYLYMNIHIVTESALLGPVGTLSWIKEKAEEDQIEESASSLKYSSLNSKKRTIRSIFDMFLIRREPGEDVLVEEPAQTSDSELGDTSLELEPFEILRM